MEKQLNSKEKLLRPFLALGKYVLFFHETQSISQKEIFSIS